jgi:hypothetical protein
VGSVSNGGKEWESSKLLCSAMWSEGRWRRRRTVWQRKGESTKSKNKRGETWVNEVENVRYAYIHRPRRFYSEEEIFKDLCKRRKCYPSDGATAPSKERGLLKET